MGNFKAFNLSNKMISSLTRQKYFSPSKVQEEVIPKALKGFNLVVNSDTGSGKTHSYLIPIFNNLEGCNDLLTYVLIISPTNELARQIFNFARGFKQEYKNIKVRLLTSETSEKENISGLKEAPNIIIATPGRLISLIKKGHVKIDKIKSIILDEADMLLELGYFNEVDYLMNGLDKSNLQIMIFSATINKNLENRIIKYIGSDYEITSSHSKTSNNVSHYLIDIHHQDVNKCVLDFIKIKNPYFIIIFASNKNDVNSLYNFLKFNKFKVALMTGDLTDRERKATLKRINNDEFQIVVASDLLSRGMDFKNVSDILSINLPSDLTYYYHRAGRSGRFNALGNSYVFYNVDSTKKIEDLISQGIKFNYLSLKNNELKEGKELKKNFINKRKIDTQLLKDIKKAKFENKGKKVKPGYKKKVKIAINKVKQKYKREIIRKDIRRQKVERYKKEARGEFND